MTLFVMWLLTGVIGNFSARSASSRDSLSPAAGMEQMCMRKALVVPPSRGSPSGRVDQQTVSIRAIQ